MFAAYHENSFVPAFFKVTDLLDNLESGKRNYCFGKKSGKSLEFISWYLCKGLTTVKKREDQLGILGSKAGMVKRTEKNC